MTKEEQLRDWLLKAIEQLKNPYRQVGCTTLARELENKLKALDAEVPK